MLDEFFKSFPDLQFMTLHVFLSDCFVVHRNDSFLLKLSYVCDGNFLRNFAICLYKKFWNLRLSEELINNSVCVTVGFILLHAKDNVGSQF